MFSYVQLSFKLELLSFDPINVLNGILPSNYKIIDINDKLSEPFQQQ